MARRHRFRLVYVICEDNSIIEPFEMVNMYKRKDYADTVCRQRNEYEKAQVGMYHNTGRKRIPIHKVHGFYLVHESLFEDLLKRHSK